MFVQVVKVGAWERYALVGGPYVWDSTVEDWVRHPKKPTLFASKEDAEKALATAKPLTEFVTTVSVIVNGPVELDALKRLLRTGAVVRLTYDRETAITARIEEIDIDWQTLVNPD